MKIEELKKTLDSLLKEKREFEKESIEAFIKTFDTDGSLKQSIDKQGMPRVIYCHTGIHNILDSLLSSLFSLKVISSEHVSESLIIFSWEDMLLDPFRTSKIQSFEISPNFTSIKFDSGINPDWRDFLEQRYMKP